ncbi:MAG: AMP-binding protein [Oleiphilaceae bacterium]|nr:AMP-binding protein [Oleiphilaceae bacterium]
MSTPAAALKSTHNTPLNAGSAPKVTIAETPEMANAPSFLHIFYEREKLHPNKVYLRQPEGERWHELSWREVGDQARKVVAALRAMGLKPGDHVGLLSKNCAQWIIADLAILMGGYVSVPFYPTLPADELAEVIKLSDIKALFIGKLEGWEQQQSGVPEHIHCIRFPHYQGNSEVQRGLKWEEITKGQHAVDDPHMPAADELFTIIYTSGTTGTPKGVMLTYECANAVMRFERAHPRYGIYQGVSERVISYLPLNHIAERVVSEVSTIVAGSEVSFSESLDRFAANLQSVQPTQFFAVPRIWVKIQQGILAKLPQQKLDKLLGIPIVSGLIKKKIRKGLGLNQVRSAISGAAPISASTLEWFAKLDIVIQEVYGATELCGGVTYNAIGETRPGTVGRPLPGTDIQIDPETDEVLVKAPWVMKGYYKDPEKTAEVFKGDYYRTGDTGRFDERGNLIITGRIKDTFKTAKGKFILPVPIEQKLGRNFAIEQVVVAGFGLDQPLALISLSQAAREQHHDVLLQHLHETLDDINSELDGYAKISHMVLFTSGWEEDSGLFTPTLKIKRHVVDARYKEDYHKWASSKERIVWA